jgi:hypothetical protein
MNGVLPPRHQFTICDKTTKGKNFLKQNQVLEDSKDLAAQKQYHSSKMLNSSISGTDADDFL